MPGRQVAPSTPLATIDELIATTAGQQNAAFQKYGGNSAEFVRLQNLKENYEYIKNHDPKGWDKKKKELTLNDIGDLLLDLTGYGAAIASLMPIPAIRAGGMLVSNLSGAARQGKYGNWSGAAQGVARASRSYYSELGQNKRREYYANQKNRR